jgi:hypothetical protein
MTQIKWDQTGERLYETGVSHGVLYLPDAFGAYEEGHAWNGLTAVTESPSGAEATKQYADNTVYLNLVSVEEFGGTIEAFTYPKKFEACDGTASPSAGIAVGQQRRKSFGLSYETLIGNDVDGTDYGTKIHLVYGALAAPSEKARATVNDSPEAVAFSWTFTTTPVEVPGVDEDGKPFKNSATLTIDSTLVDATAFAALKSILYGTEGTDPRLPLPEEVFALFEGSIDVVAPTEPAYNATTKVITIPAVTGVQYKINGVNKAAGVLPAITVDTIVSAVPKPGYQFAPQSDDDWLFEV